MSSLIECTKAILSDPDSALSEQVHMIGLLAIVLIATDSHDAIAEEARATVIGFWQERAVTR